MSSPVPGNIGPNPSIFVPIYPFSNAAGADTILRSSDGADFYVHRAILSLVSPVFETMFHIPQPESAPAVPVIDVSESSGALNRALSFFYPAAHANVATVEELKEVIGILVSKYDMQCVIPTVKLHLEKYRSSDPLAVYAIAAAYGWEDIALAAAKESLKHPLRNLSADAPPSLDGLTAAAYHNLLQYHYRCGEAARLTTIVLPADSLAGGLLRVCNTHPTAPIRFSDSTRTVAGWFADYLKDMGSLLAVTPSASIHEQSSFYDALANAKCTSCGAFDTYFRFLTVVWPAQLKAEIDKVDLKF
ncbi:hypothetical protein MVEN_00691100 [Mycena venus]|uniref:BTB domain-containing protein n=1 Tax=Mycena venus TaxID=2733690 RepID=A0A8H6YIL2_9AGAR|nr:hypothetical protein MVEN_00691100 [Mycena venus]